MVWRSHHHVPDSNSHGMSPAETGSQITLYQTQVTRTAFRASDQLPILLE